jgi:hypothetical protein
VERKTGARNGRYTRDSFCVRYLNPPQCKQRPPGASHSKDAETTNRSANPIEAFVHSNPTSPVDLPTPSILPNSNEATLRRPSIDGYFTQVPTSVSLRNKRMRSPSDLRTGKRLFR